MKKNGVIFWVCLIGFIILSTGTVLPQVSSKPLMKTIKTIEQKRMIINEKTFDIDRKGFNPSCITNIIKKCITLLIKLIYSLIDIIRELMSLVNLIGFLIDLIYMLMDMIQDLIDAILNLVPSATSASIILKKS